MAWEGAYIRLSSECRARYAECRIAARRDLLPEGVTFRQMGNVVVFKGPRGAMQKPLERALEQIAKEST